MLILLSGCTGNQGAAYQSFHQAFFGNNPDFSKLPKQSGVTYLDVDFGGTQARLGRGYLYDKTNQQTEVYYSAKGEVLRLQSSRLVSTAGLPVDLLSVQYKFNDIGNLDVLFSETPNGLGYQNLKLNLIGPVAPPHLAFKPPKESQARWTWYAAQTSSQGVFPNQFNYMLMAFDQPLPKSALYSGNWPMAVYGIQCIQPTTCIQWYRP